MAPARWATETVSAPPEASRRCTSETERRGGSRKEGVIIPLPQIRRPPRRFPRHPPPLRVRLRHHLQRLRLVVIFIDRNNFLSLFFSSHFFPFFNFIFIYFRVMPKKFHTVPFYLHFTSSSFSSPLLRLYSSYDFLVFLGSFILFILYSKRKYCYVMKEWGTAKEEEKPPAPIRYFQFFSSFAVPPFFFSL